MNIAGNELLSAGGISRGELRWDRDEVLSRSKSTSSSSPNSKSSSPSTFKSTESMTPRRAGQIERDFYKNPTVLSRMILFQKYANANKRCRDHPEEAPVWVCARRKLNVSQVAPIFNMFDAAAAQERKTQQQKQQQRQQKDVNATEYSLRQLPIHVACTALAYSHDPTSRVELEQLIVRLVVTYPEGCSEADHTGRLPLHLSLFENAASPETIAMLLMAAPNSIEQMDPQGRKPMEYNERRMAKNKSDIRDMLLLGIDYWDQARQEARLRMKLAVIPTTDQSIASTSVMATSQFENETIYTTDLDNFDSNPLPKDDKSRRRKPRVVIESEEITPMAWEQLERRVVLLERLLAEMYETNYNLGGLVHELKKTKKNLLKELDAARWPAAQTKTSHSGKRGPSSSPGPQNSPEVVPEDDAVSTMSSVKFLEHTERIEQLESLVGSVHSKTRQKRLKAGSSCVSELSFCSTNTGSRDAVVPRRFSGANSYVSGLTNDERCIADSVNAVRGVDSPEEEDADASEDDQVMYSDMRDVAQELETDNLSEMFHKVADVYGSGGKNLVSPSPPKAIRRSEDVPIRLPSKRHLQDVPVWRSPPRLEQEQRSSSRRRRPAQAQIRDEPPSEAGDIYFPGYAAAEVPLDREPSHVNSTISMSASSNSASSSSNESMSMDSSIVDSSVITSTGTEIFVGRGSDSVVDDHDETKDSMSTRACLVAMGFENVYDQPSRQTQDASNLQESQSSYNFDISIPALNVPFDMETGEI